jgi:hypothetical protein
MRPASELADLFAMVGHSGAGKVVAATCRTTKDSEQETTQNR